MQQRKQEKTKKPTVLKILGAEELQENTPKIGKRKKEAGCSLQAHAQ